MIIVFVLMFAITGTSCKTTTAAETAAAETTAAAGKKLRFGYNNAASSEIFMVCMQGFINYCDENGIEKVITQNQKEADVTEQFENCASLIAQGVDAIEFVVLDGKIDLTTVENARAAGIKVGTPTSSVDAAMFAPNAPDVVIQGNDYVGAYAEAEYMAKVLGGKGNICILMGPPGVKAAKDRKDAYDAVLVNYPDIKLLSAMDCGYETQKSFDIVADWLTKYPEIDAMFTLFDPGTFAAMEAIKEAGRENDNIMLFDFDGIQRQFEAIAKNQLQATVWQNFTNMSYLCTQNLHRLLTWPTAQRVHAQVEFIVITRDNLLDYLPEYKELWVD